LSRAHQRAQRIRLILDDGPKRWEGITEEDMALWQKTYGKANVPYELQEMISYWDGQPANKRKLDWKRAIVNRLKWVQDHGGTKHQAANGEYQMSDARRRFLEEKD
jgi:hypothetical protein